MERVSTTKAVLAVEEAMSEETKTDFLERVFAVNPQLRGAKVADVLDIFADADAYIEVTEPWWNRRTEDFAGAERQCAGYAAISSAVLYGDVDDEWVESLTGGAMQRLRDGS